MLNQDGIKLEVPQNLIRLERLVDEVFGKSAKQLVIRTDEMELHYVLYSSFILKTGFSGRYELFFAGIYVNGINIFIRDETMVDVSMNTDDKSILDSLKSIDEYCRLRLPDKFLKVFEDLNT